MTAPDPTAGEREHPTCVASGPHYFPEQCQGESVWVTSSPAVAASTGTSEDVEPLLDCECGHSLDEHNGLGCYARLSYEPLVQCSCALTDDRTHGELLAPRLASLLAARDAAARAAERERIAQAIEAERDLDPRTPFGLGLASAAQIAREAR